MVVVVYAKRRLTRPTIAALLVDFSRNRLFHRKLAVGAKENAYGRCHLRPQGGGLFPPTRPLAPEDVPIIRLLPRPIGVQWRGLEPQLPKLCGWLPLVWIIRAGKVEKSCICKGEKKEKTRSSNTRCWCDFDGAESKIQINMHNGLVILSFNQCWQK